MLREQYYKDILIEFSQATEKKVKINDTECTLFRPKNIICIIDWEKLIILWKENQVKWISKYTNKKSYK